MPISLKAGLGGGGGSVPIGGVIQLSMRAASPLVEIDGQVYLETGMVLRGEAENYPEAAAALLPNLSYAISVSNSAVGNAYSCAYGAGRFVVVGQTAGVALVSTDGETWETKSTGLTAFTSGGQLTYGAGKFVANNGYSLDGLTWTASSSALTYLRYLNNRFFSFAGASIKTSVDGVTWTTAQTLSITNMVSAAFGAGKYVVVGGAGKVAVSSDGATWSVVSTPATIDFVRVGYGAGAFVAATANALYRSVDGVTWTQVFTNAGTTFRTMIFAEGVFILTTRGSSDFVLISRDGISWNRPSRMEGVRLGVDACFAEDKRILLFAAETTYINRIHTDQIGLPVTTYFGAVPGGQAGGTVKTGAIDYLRIK